MRQAYNTIDRSGQSFANWTIISYTKTINKKRFYICKCVCGFIKESNIKSIVSGVSKSCGCQNIKNHIIHGKSNDRVYNIWQNIKNRCYNPKSDKWQWYGGRGIKMCERWLNSFSEFYKDMGEPTTPKHSIDRINNDGNYEPSNCRWATAKEQANNRRLPEPPKKG